MAFLRLSLRQSAAAAMAAVALQAQLCQRRAPRRPKIWNKHAGYMVIACQARGEDAFALSHALLRALWAEERDISDPVVRVAVADENGYDGRALQALERAQETQALYEQYRRVALDRGVFWLTHHRHDGRRALLGAGSLGLLVDRMRQQASARSQRA